jgi:hypothetical protein
VLEIGDDVLLPRLHLFEIEVGVKVLAVHPGLD